MTQSTTVVTACDVAIWLDNAAGALKDISGSSNACTISLTNQLGMFRTFSGGQGNWPVRTECGKDGSFNLSVLYSTANDEGLDILRDWFFANPPGNRSIKVYVPSKNVGSDVYAAEVKIESLNIPLNAGDANPVLVTANLLPTGAISVQAATT